MDYINVSTKSLLSSNEIPIIDLSFNESDVTDNKSWTKEIAYQLNHAFSTNGLAFLINHGISKEEINGVYNTMETFCSLPEDTRLQYKIDPPDLQGYLPPGSEVLKVDQGVDFRYTYNILNLSGKLPTKEICNCQEVIGGVTKKYIRLTKFLLRLLAENLDVDPNVMLSLHKGMMVNDSSTTFRMIYYPPVGDEMSTNITRCGEHNDFGTFTLLTEDVDGGLEVLQGGQWKRVGHLPGAILIIVAEMLDIWTYSKYKSVRHRVIIPEEDNARNKGRYSSAFFVLPDNKTLAHPSALRPQLYQNEGENSHSQQPEKIPTVLEFLHKELSKAYVS